MWTEALTPRSGGSEILDIAVPEVPQRRRRRLRRPRRRPRSAWLALLAVAIVSWPVAVFAAFLPSDHAIVLEASDFRRYSTGPAAITSPDAVSWVLPEPTQPRPDGRLAVDDAVSLGAFPLGRLSFSATFLAPSAWLGHPEAFGDELVVFAASDTISYHGFELGVRLGLADGSVYAYSQYPNPLGGVVFQEDRLFANDGLPHSYELTLLGNAVSFAVDGAFECVEYYPILPLTTFHIVTTAHRATGGWTDPGVALDVAAVTVYPSSS